MHSREFWITLQIKSPKIIAESYKKRILSFGSGERVNAVEIIHSGSSDYYDSIIKQKTVTMVYKIIV